MKLKRIHPTTNEVFVPHRFEDGMYRVADPRNGSKKHHAAKQIKVHEADVEVWVRRGFHLRMRGLTSRQVNLISPEEITF